VLPSHHFFGQPEGAETSHIVEGRKESIQVIALEGVMAEKKKIGGGTTETEKRGRRKKKKREQGRDG